MVALPKIFLDSGDPTESKRAEELLGNLDGQTTNPTLVSKHPEAQKHLAQGKKFTHEELLKFYKEVVSEIEKVTAGPISVEVYADWDTTAETMFNQAQEMFTWGKNIHIKFPTITQGLKAAQQFLSEGGRINMTLVFDQNQAAAVYALQNNSSRFDNGWRESRDPDSAQSLTSTDGKGRATGPVVKKNSAVFVSPFMGRWDDRGKNGLDLLKNIIQMYGTFPSPTPLVLASSIRSMDHFLGSISLGADLLTVPLKIIEEWTQKGKPLPDPALPLSPTSTLQPISYEELPMKSFDEFQISQNPGDLLDEGLQKFTKDWNNLLA